MVRCTTLQGSDLWQSYWRITDSLHPNGPHQGQKPFTAALKLLFAIGIETVRCENEAQRALHEARGFLSIFWDVPRANTHAVGDIGAVVDWLTNWRNVLPKLMLSLPRLVSMQVSRKSNQYTLVVANSTPETDKDCIA